MGMQGDFFQLLKAQGYQFGASGGGSHDQQFTTATTILAFKYRDGVLVAGDRRATAGNMVMYDRTDKVLEIDRHSVMAIAGVPATAYEMVRILEHSFKYYRRTQLQELSFDGKLRAVSKLLEGQCGCGTGRHRRRRSDFRRVRFRARDREDLFLRYSWARSSKAWSMPFQGPAPPRSGASCIM